MAFGCIVRSYWMQQHGKLSWGMHHGCYQQGSLSYLATKCLIIEINDLHYLVVRPSFFFKSTSNYW